MPKGTWSDDSSMMLITAASIVEKDKIDLTDIMDGFFRWAKSGYMTQNGKPFGIGRTTLRALGNYWRGLPAENCGRNFVRDNGNGSLMRILPVALWNAFDGYTSRQGKNERVRSVSALTHSHPISCTACEIYAFIVERLINKKKEDSIRKILADASKIWGSNPESEVFQRIFDDNFLSLKDESIKSSGYVVDTLETSLWGFGTTDTYSECVLKAVNLGGDTDTIAAIAGALAGLKYEMDGIPKEWMDTIYHSEIAVQLCEKFVKLAQEC